MSETPSTPDQPAVSPAPSAPTPPPVPPSGAALPPPLPQAAATPRNRARTGTIIGVVVGVVAGGGIVAGLLNTLGSDDAQASEPTVLDVTPPPPTAPALADAGTVSAPITLPGPAVQPPVTTAPPATTAPDTAPASPDTTDPGLQPPSTEPSDEEPTSTPSDTVQMTAGISFAVPAGWEVLSSGEGYAAIGNGSTMVFVNVYASASSASEMLFGYQSVITNDLAGAEFGDIGTAEIYSNLVIDAAAFSYRGYAGQGQSGSTLVEGTAFGDVRYDGVGIVTDVMWVPDSEGVMSESDRADLNVVFGSFVYGE